MDPEGIQEWGKNMHKCLKALLRPFGRRGEVAEVGGEEGKRVREYTVQYIYGKDNSV